MRILDANGNEIKDIDFSLGKVVKEKLFVKTHPAIEEIKEQWHYKTIIEYPNGGKEVEKVIDVIGVSAKDSWDEYEDILRYIPYTDEELEEINKPTVEERIAQIEEALNLLLEGATE